MPAIFNEDLEYSIENFNERKKIYKKMGIENLKFVDFNTEEEKALQRQDIDVIGTEIYDKKQVGISEKIRRRPYRYDILVEMYSIFEKNIPGWLKDSSADLLACFFTDKTIAVNVKTLKTYMHEFLKKNKNFVNLVKSIATEMIESGKKFSKIKGYDGICVAIADNGTYHTVSLVIKTDTLKNNGVIINEYA